MDKKIVILVVGILLVVGLLVVKNVNSVNRDSVNEGEVENLHEVSFAIEGMYCESCAYGVEAQFKELGGVVSADVDYQTAKGLVKYDADKINPESIASASTVYPAKIVDDKIV